MMHCNLLSPAAQLNVRVLDRTRVWCVVLAGYLVALTIGASVAWSAGRVEAVLPAGLVLAAEEEASRIEHQVDSVYAQVRHQQAQLAAELAIGRHPDWSVLLSVIARLRGPFVDLSGIELHPMGDPLQASKSARPSRYVVEISGIAISHAELAAMVLRFEQIGVFERVVLAQNRVAEAPGTGIEFIVHAEMDDSPSPEPQRARTEGDR